MKNTSLRKHTKTSQVESFDKLFHFIKFKCRLKFQMSFWNRNFVFETYRMTVLISTPFEHSACKTSLVKILQIMFLLRLPEYPI